MDDEESNYLQKIHQEDIICNSMQHLSTASDPLPSAKRHSALYRSSLLEPLPKRPTLNPSTAAPPSPTIYSPPTITNSTAAPPQFLEIPPIKNHPMSTVNVDQESHPLQEIAPISAPIAGTPPRLPAKRDLFRSPVSSENPTAKRLRRMKERLREMREWWNQVATEDDDEEECEEETQNPSQEAVFVEKSGECLVLHFKCPCGDGYQVLLSGNNLYYKLTNFRDC
ncbi:mucin-7-like [Salvia hispanica]|uniref:mucin-7-like n=1 Tax=Salvia hispanica TaxID=49212 RepID=UPI002008F3A3|nr:mucin-7-like [Salvia hispanica]